MDIIEKIKERAKKVQKTIVLPETEDLRTIKAAALIKKEGFAKIILIGDEEKIKEISSLNNLDIDGIEVINPKTSDKTENLINEFYELRKAKGMSLEEAKNIISTNYLYFGDMLVKLGYADGLVAGAINSSANVLRAALQTIKTAPDSKIVSSFFIMDVPNCEYGSNGIFLYSDCGMIQNPTSEELAEIAYSSSKSFKQLIEQDPIIAMLSHSTFGSSKHSDVDKVVNAIKIAKEKYPNLILDGELQADAAIVPSVAKSKAPNSNVAGKANVLIFPDLDAGNIAYKLTERLAKAKAYGPVTQGIAKPVNDLSRGCNEYDIVGVVAITCVQCD